MQFLEYGNKDAPVVLVQPVNGYDLSGMDVEIAAIQKETNRDFFLLGIKVDDWNNDLSLWRSKNVFGKGEFAGRAQETLNEILKKATDKDKKYYIGGYSLAGLFALWAATKTDAFSGVAAASPSTWYDGFCDYLQDRSLPCPVYLSLGKDEDKAKLKVLAATAEKIKETYAILQKKGVDCTLVWNEGNHFQDTHLRTAKAFSWVMNRN